MRATLDWSYGLLTVEEQSLFRLLSTFVGGFRLEDVERVVDLAGGRGQPAMCSAGAGGTVGAVLGGQARLMLSGAPGNGCWNPWRSMPALG